jgi:hypothetical protein
VNVYLNLSKYLTVFDIDNVVVVLILQNKSIIKKFKYYLTFELPQGQKAPKINNPESGPPNADSKLPVIYAIIKVKPMKEKGTVNNAETLGNVHIKC